MLIKYNKYLNSEILTESHMKPDPPGVKAIQEVKSYRNEFNNIMREVLSKAKKEATDKMVETLREEWIGKIVSMHDENGRQKILEVNEIHSASKGDDYYPLIVEDKDRKFRFYWEDEAKSRLFDVGRFLKFFEEHYIDQYIMFHGKPVKGGDSIKYTKHVLRIGVHNGTTQDFLIVESDDKTSQLLIHNQPIKIMDQKLKILDPYGEENWDN
jgi:hypothetical protein